MEPQFRFCTSADGTRIAYATYGSGPALLYANTPVVSMDAQFTLPEARAFFDALAARAMVVIFDRRGSGASAREADDLSLEAEALDIAAVADAAELRDFTLFADIAAPMCARYAVQHQERVRRVIFWCPFIGVGGDWDKKRAAYFREDWTYARRLWAGRIYPQGPVSLQRAFSKVVKNTLSADMVARRFELPAVDLAELLPAVTAPALVLQRAGPLPRQIAIHAARLLPNSELRFVAGDATTPFPEHEPIVEAITEFMGADLQHAAPSGTAIILFADIADSTALTERLGDAAFRAKARELDERLRAAVAEAGGSAIEGKLLGDGVLATFGGARDALACAIGCRRHAAEAGLSLHLGLHLGLHAGDVIREDDNVFGGAVNIAARIAAECPPGQVLVSGTVRDLARTSAGVSFEDAGEHTLKGVSEPVRVWAVRA